MKQIFFIAFLLIITKPSTAQNAYADSILALMQKVSSDSSLIRLMNHILYSTNDLDQQQRIDYSKRILDLAKKKHNKVLESVITAELGYIIAINGNSLQGAELVFSALEMAQKHKNEQALGIIYQDLAVCFKNDIHKHKEYLYKALPYSTAAGDHFNLAANLLTISRYHSSIQQPDSALHYAQRSLELCLFRNVQEFLHGSLMQLAHIHYQLLDHKKIAFEYMREALNTKYALENPDAYVSANASMASLMEKEGLLDSALYYTHLAYAELEKARFTLSLNIYDLYKNIYLKINSDSAVKYYVIYDTLKDSINNVSDAQEQQLLSIKKDIELENIALQRKLNLQYLLIALGIIAFLTIYLLLSRSFITNTKLIKFLGIFGLLIVFEFLNLLIHPFLEKVTHHTPLLILIALVGFAALLIPMHHRIEKWLTEKLIEKNKEIRLSTAKKTIEQLEETQEM